MMTDAFADEMRSAETGASRAVAETDGVELSVIIPTFNVTIQVGNRSCGFQHGDQDG